MNVNRWARVKPVFYEAMDQPVDERAAFINSQCNGDEALALEIESLLAAHDQAYSFIESPVLDTAEPDFAIDPDKESGALVGSYRIIRRIGSGGMGSVYLGARADESFDKQVAIKLIRHGLDTDFIIRRFVSERQMLARLEHPNIARLVDGGTTEQGVPYLVIEYVEGKMLTDYCDDHALSTTERLKLFRRICAAVHYAHQNLIVHRDIKPSNILVTADGEPKLLDFGIAKLLSFETESAQTTTLFGRVMTPDYASPEQARGEPVTTASDVYSLGVLLYELLAGCRPYRITTGSPMEMARAICEQQPKKPSTAVQRGQLTGGGDAIVSETRTPGDARRRGLPAGKLRRQLEGDLDNIVLMALRKEPERRYPSVEQFAEDIRRHLDGLPVRARPSTLAYRSGKFIGRHKARVVAAAFAVLALIAGTIISTSEAHRANSERAKAEQRFQDVRKISNSLLSDVQDSLQNTSGTMPARLILAQRGLEYLDSLAQDNSNDPVLLGELGTAYIKIQAMQMAVLHDSSGALQSAQKAVAIQRRRVGLAPSDPVTKRELGVGLFGLSEALRSRYRYEEWLQTTAEIMALQQDLITAEPDNLQNNSLALAGTYETRGEMLNGLTRHAEAEADFRLALDLITRAINLAKDTSQDPQARVGLSTEYIWQGEVYGHLGAWQKAAESQQQAGVIAEATWRETPSLTQALRNTSRSHRCLGEALDRLGDYQGALESYRTSLHVITEALAQDPASDTLLYGESYYTVKVGLALHKIGETEQAFALVRRGLRLARQNLIKGKEVALARINTGEIFELGGDLLARTGHRSEATSIYLDLLRCYEEMLKQSPHEPELLAGVARYSATVGDLYSRFNAESQSLMTTNRAELLEARRWYQESLEAFRQQREEMTTPEPANQETADAFLYKANLESAAAVAAKLALCDDKQE